MVSLVIEAFGNPQTQGSARAYVKGGRAVVTSDNPNLASWRDTVAWAARAALTREPAWVQAAGPVRADVAFWLRRPVSAPKTRDILPVTGLDVDKMLRSIFDSLTNAGVWVDDNRACLGTYSKRYAVGPHLPKIYRPGFHWQQPGVSVVVSTIEDGT
jgi:Holliday junction resolvase RusA-like endonuclease